MTGSGTQNVSPGRERSAFSADHPYLTVATFTVFLRRGLWRGLAVVRMGGRGFVCTHRSEPRNEPVEPRDSFRYVAPLGKVGRLAQVSDDLEGFQRDELSCGECLCHRSSQVKLSVAPWSIFVAIGEELREFQNYNPLLRFRYGACFAQLFLDQIEGIGQRRQRGQLLLCLYFGWHLARASRENARRSYRQPSKRAAEFCPLPPHRRCIFFGSLGGVLRFRPSSEMQGEDPSHSCTDQRGQHGQPEPRPRIAARDLVGEISDRAHDCVTGIRDRRPRGWSREQGWARGRRGSGSGSWYCGWGRRHVVSVLARSPSTGSNRQRAAGQIVTGLGFPAGASAPLAAGASVASDARPLLHVVAASASSRETPPEPGDMYSRLIEQVHAAARVAWRCRAPVLSPQLGHRTIRRTRNARRIGAGTARSCSSAAPTRSRRESLPECGAVSRPSWNARGIDATGRAPRQSSVLGSGGARFELLEKLRRRRGIVRTHMRTF